MLVPLPQSIDRIAMLLGRLPGIGRRSAMRCALSMLKWSDGELGALAEELTQLHQRVHTCVDCGNLTDGERCVICEAPNRRRDQLCVVEQAQQIQVFEQSGCYNGLYHVLGGRLSPISGIGPEQLSISALQRRVASGGVTEVILATGMDVEGEATANYLAELFRGQPVAITRLASGLAVGSNPGYADAPTLGRALAGRRPL